MKAAPSIDIHAHFFPQAYLDLLAEHGAPHGVTCLHDDPAGPVIVSQGKRTPPLDARYYDLEVRVAAMDAQGVDVQALSLTAPMVYWAPAPLARGLCEAYNDGCIAAHAAYPERFVGLAILPMLEPEAALAELERVAGDPAIRGIYTSTRIGDRELSDPLFFPVYEALQARRLPLLLHPVKVVEPARLERFYLTNFIGNPTESAIAASHLIFGEVLDRFPTLDVVLPHAGGTFPYLVGRITHGWGVRAECRHLATPPDQYLRRFHYDTITHAHPALAYLIDLVGADRVMLGSDFCFDMAYERPVDVVMQHPGLDDERRAQILGGNAQRLLNL